MRKLLYAEIQKLRSDKIEYEFRCYKYTFVFVRVVVVLLYGAAKCYEQYKRHTAAKSKDIVY